ncbi:FKBP-type peptidyl-prolyl cis-trans isomerase [Acinetobacter rudis]|uniref:Peptidyl-prolyl cis-trans isomerase n=1 Tax=Acinetobacter rudis CIP 110305 TaxID=421052 RepID=S3MS96_9GAMM|nr:FKBP-type peptidyl-prolyl cis-trans isomerase [Acinetobacter rudis]EPF69393.1 FKBP-type peptidyl-prolyl cis-trans isomerase FklB [Acinetobacter rudis CIP 110305]
MKKALLCSSIFFLCSASYAASVNNRSTQQEQFSYSYGYQVGLTYAEILKDVDMNTFLEGVKQGTAGKEPSLTKEEMKKAMFQYQKSIEAMQLEKLKQIAAENALKEKSFLESNLKNTGITQTKSGLQYQVLTAGTGKTPKATSKVLVHYEGRLLDDTVFDSSIARDQPVEFQVSQVIPGWSEGLQLMKEGAKYRFFIPAKLAYGEIGSGDAIGPNNTLIFEVELLKIVQ